jgi:hypothetical protein
MAMWLQAGSYCCILFLSNPILRGHKTFLLHLVVVETVTLQVAPKESTAGSEAAGAQASLGWAGHQTCLPEQGLETLSKATTRNPPPAAGLVLKQTSSCELGWCKGG